MKNAYSHTQIYFQNELTEIADTKRKTINFSEEIKKKLFPPGQSGSIGLVWSCAS